MILLWSVDVLVGVVDNTAQWGMDVPVPVLLLLLLSHPFFQSIYNNEPL